MSRIRGPYVRFCERDEANLISSPHPTRYSLSRKWSAREQKLRHLRQIPVIRSLPFHGGGQEEDGVF